MTLPDCMMPDGADPCKAYSELLVERDHLRTEYERLKQMLKDLEPVIDLGMRMARILDTSRKP
jgi:hypothetical protein